MWPIYRTWERHTARCSLLTLAYICQHSTLIQKFALEVCVKRDDDVFNLSFGVYICSSVTVFECKWYARCSQLIVLIGWLQVHLTCFFGFVDIQCVHIVDMNFLPWTLRSEISAISDFPRWAICDARMSLRFDRTDLWPRILYKKVKLVAARLKTEDDEGPIHTCYYHPSQLIWSQVNSIK